MLKFARKAGKQAAAPRADYEPPLVVTVVRGKSHRAYQQLKDWEPPPGAEDHNFLRHTVVCPSVRPGLLVRSLSDSIVIQDPGSLDCHGLNRTAAKIIGLADGTRSIASIARDFMDRFGVDAETAWNDVFVTLEELFDKKVLVAGQRGAIEENRPD